MPINRLQFVYTPRAIPQRREFATVVAEKNYKSVALGLRVHVNELKREVFRALFKENIRQRRILVIPQNGNKLKIDFIKHVYDLVKILSDEDDPKLRVLSTMPSPIRVNPMEGGLLFSLASELTNRIQKHHSDCNDPIQVENFTPDLEDKLNKDGKRAIVLVLPPQGSKTYYFAFVETSYSEPEIELNKESKYN